MNALSHSHLEAFFGALALTAVAAAQNLASTTGIWNGPDLNRAGTAPADAAVNLCTRTANMVCEINPKGRMRVLPATSTMPTYFSPAQARGDDP